jgi:hypothetical protein
MLAPKAKKEMKIYFAANKKEKKLKQATKTK